MDGMSEEPGEEVGMVVARIRIERRMIPDGGDDGECPASVELLGMLAMTTDSVLHGGIYGDEDDQ